MSHESLSMTSCHGSSSSTSSFVYKVDLVLPAMSTMCSCAVVKLLTLSLGGWLLKQCLDELYPIVVTSCHVMFIRLRPRDLGTRLYSCCCPSMSMAFMWCFALLSDVQPNRTFAHAFHPLEGRN
jgi:hypothetical protein